MTTNCADRRQMSFAEIALDPGWAATVPPRPAVDAPDLAPNVRAQAREFEAAVVALGIGRPNTGRTYRKALECVAKQAHRHLGRPLADMAELFEEKLIAAVAADDRPFDLSTPRLSRYTKRQQRVVLGAYLRAIGVPGLTYEQGRELLKRGFRRASQRRGYRYVIGAGRPEQRDSYRPSPEDVVRFLAAASRWRQFFAGPCLAAAAALTLWHGLRPVSVLAVDGRDFRWRRDALFLVAKEKAVSGKRERREIELRPPVVAFLARYVAAHNSYMASRGSSEVIGIGVAGPFFRGLRGGPWLYDALRGAYARCCRRAHVQPFTPQGLRRLYASGMAAVLSLAEAAIAGGWKNVGVFERHYARSLRKWQPELPAVRPAVRLEGGPLAIAASGVRVEEAVRDGRHAAPA